MLVMGALVVALYAGVVTLWELRGRVRDSPSRLLLGLLTDFVLSLLYILIVAALTYLGLRFTWLELWKIADRAGLRRALEAF